MVIIQPPGYRCGTTLRGLEVRARAQRCSYQESAAGGEDISRRSSVGAPRKARGLPGNERALERAVQRSSKLDVLSWAKLRTSYILEHLIKDLRQMVQTALENGVAVPGWKLWTNALRKWGLTSEITASSGVLVQISCTRRAAVPRADGKGAQRVRLGYRRS